MSDRDQILKTLRDAKSGLLERYPIEWMAIFGSVARGDGHSDSDVDILVQLSRPIGLRFLELASELETMLKRPIDLVSKNGVKLRYLETIEPDLIRV